MSRFASSSTRRRSPPARRRSHARRHAARPRATRPSTGCRSPRRDAGRGSPRRATRRVAGAKARDHPVEVPGSARMSGPSRLRIPRSSSSTAPLNIAPTYSSPRSTSQGRPKIFVSLRNTRHRPFMRRWLRRTSPPSKWSRRFLPTASTRSSRRPSSRRRELLHGRTRMRRLDLELARRRAPAAAAPPSEARRLRAC